MPALNMCANAGFRSLPKSLLSPLPVWGCACVKPLEKHAVKCRDGTTSTVLLIGELMKQAERYLNEGCHPRVLAEVTWLVFPHAPWHPHALEGQGSPCMHCMQDRSPGVATGDNTCMAAGPPICARQLSASLAVIQ